MAPRSLIIGEKAKARLRYFFGDVIREGMKESTARRVLLKQFMEDPLTFAERVDKLLPADPLPDKSGGPAINLNLAFLEAVKGAQALPAPQPIELEARIVSDKTDDDRGTDGVQW